jgi:hypothetical protein
MNFELAAVYTALLVVFLTEKRRDVSNVPLLNLGHKLFEFAPRWGA